MSVVPSIADFDWAKAEEVARERGIRFDQALREVRAERIDRARAARSFLSTNWVK